MFLFYYMLFSVIGYMYGFALGQSYAEGLINGTVLVILTVGATIGMMVAFVIIGMGQAKSKGIRPWIGALVTLPWIGFVVAIWLQFTKSRLEPVA